MYLLFIWGQTSTSKNILNPLNFLVHSKKIQHLPPKISDTTLEYHNDFNKFQIKNVQ